MTCFETNKMQESQKPDKRFWIMSFSGVYLCCVSHDGAPAARLPGNDISQKGQISCNSSAEASVKSCLPSKTRWCPERKQHALQPSAAYGTGNACQWSKSHATYLPFSCNMLFVIKNCSCLIFHLQFSCLHVLLRFWIKSKKQEASLFSIEMYNVRRQCGINTSLHKIWGWLWFTQRPTYTGSAVHNNVTLNNPQQTVNQDQILELNSN